MVEPGEEGFRLAGVLVFRDANLKVLIAVATGLYNIQYTQVLEGFRV